MTETPTIAAPDNAPELPDAIRGAGGEPALISFPAAPLEWGVALTREWIADAAHLEIVNSGAEALLLPDGAPEELAGYLSAALRAGVPAVLDVDPSLPLTPFSAALATIGLAPMSGESAPAEVAAELGRTGKPNARRLVSSFSLANALRAGLSLGGGPEIMLHLAALGREAGVAGCARMLRVLVPETPVIAESDSPWFAERGLPGLLARILGDLHHAPTVDGRLKQLLPEPDEADGEELAGSRGHVGSRLVLVEGRASATETPCRQMPGVEEVYGECRVFWSEKEAVSAVENEALEEGQILVVGGCGQRGAPGLKRLDALAGALRDSAPEGVAVFTDGLAPEWSGGVWASPVFPEAAAGGVLARLQDGDKLRLDLAERRIRVNVSADEMEDRAPGARFGRQGAQLGYAPRYASDHMKPLEGGGFSSESR